MQRYFHPYKREGRTMMTVSMQIHIGLFMYQGLFLALYKRIIFKTTQGSRVVFLSHLANEKNESKKS